MKTLIRALVAVTVLGAGSAFAATPSNGTDATKTLTVTATINASCAVSANATLAFGVYDPTSGTDNDNSTSVSFKCTKGSIFDIGLGGTVGSRAMTSASTGDTLSYELYRDAARTLTWGNTQDTNTTNADDSADTTGNGITAGATAQTRTVYGRIVAGLDKSAASDYTNTVAITIYY